MSLDAGTRRIVERDDLQLLISNGRVDGGFRRARAFDQTNEIVRKTLIRLIFSRLRRGRALGACGLPNPPSRRLRRRPPWNARTPPANP